MDFNLEKELALKLIRGTGVYTLVLGVMFVILSLLSFISAISRMIWPVPPELRIIGPGPAVLVFQAIVLLLFGLLGIKGNRWKMNRRGRSMMLVFGLLLCLVIPAFPILLEFPVAITLYFLVLGLSGMWIVFSLSFSPVRRYYQNLKNLPD